MTDCCLFLDYPIVGADVNRISFPYWCGDPCEGILDPFSPACSKLKKKENRKREKKERETRKKEREERKRERKEGRTEGRKIAETKQKWLRSIKKFARLDVSKGTEGSNQIRSNRCITTASEMAAAVLRRSNPGKDISHIPDIASQKNPTTATKKNGGQWKVIDSVSFVESPSIEIQLITSLPDVCRYWNLIRIGIAGSGTNPHQTIPFPSVC